MLKNKLAKFIAKRVLLCWILVSIIDIIFIEQKWYTLVGMLFGGVLSILRFGSYEFIFKRIISVNTGAVQKRHTAGKSLMAFTLNQIILLPFLFIAFKFNSWFFTGIVAGILFVPCVVMINGITEALRITHNNFE